MQISRVEPGSAAERAGLLSGDIILKFQNRPVNEFQVLTAEIGACEPGDKITLEISRGSETLQKEATLGAWNK